MPRESGTASAVPANRYPWELTAMSESNDLTPEMRPIDQELPGKTFTPEDLADAWDIPEVESRDDLALALAGATVNVAKTKKGPKRSGALIHLAAALQWIDSVDDATTTITFDSSTVSIDRD